MDYGRHNFPAKSYLDCNVQVLGIHSDLDEEHMWILRQLFRLELNIRLNINGKTGFFIESLRLIGK